jgi:hypothetical protein
MEADGIDTRQEFAYNENRGGVEVSGVRVRLIIELSNGSTRKLGVELPETPTVGETIEVSRDRRCVVEKVIAAPSGSRVSRFVYARASAD